MPNDQYTWDDETEPAKQEKRDATNKFLLATQTASPLRESVKQDHAEARRQFATIGKLDVPPEVEVRCLEPDPISLSKLLIFVLLAPGNPPATPPWRSGWLGARVLDDSAWHGAINEFLLRTQNDAALRGQALDRTTSHDCFVRLSGMALASDIEVICLEPMRHQLARLVVFKLLPTELYKDNWIAAWQPYRS